MKDFSTKDENFLTSYIFHSNTILMKQQTVLLKQKKTFQKTKNLFNKTKNLLKKQKKTFQEAKNNNRETRTSSITQNSFQGNQKPFCKTTLLMTVLDGTTQMGRQLAPLST